MRINYFNKTGKPWPLKKKSLAKIARRALRLAGPEQGRAVFSLILIKERESRRLNSVYRRKKKSTNALSFPAGRDLPPGAGLGDIGDIFICPGLVSRQARKERISWHKKLEYLFTHSLLHLLGYDHKTRQQEKIMTGLEEKILG